MKQSLKLAVQLLASFGFTREDAAGAVLACPSRTTSRHRKLDTKYYLKSSHAADRESIRTWLIRSLLKASGIWGSGLDTLLTAIRENHEARSGRISRRKLQTVMAKRGKSLAFTDEEVDELVEMQVRRQAALRVAYAAFPVRRCNEKPFPHRPRFPYSRFSKPKLKKAGVTGHRCGRLQRNGELPLQSDSCSKVPIMLRSKPRCQPTGWLKTSQSGSHELLWQSSVRIGAKRDHGFRKVLRSTPVLDSRPHRKASRCIPKW